MMEGLPSLLDVFTPWDYAAAGLLLALWFLINEMVRRTEENHVSTGEIMGEYRERWMLNAADRDNRIFDATLLTGLRNGAAFFASASLAALGGAVALLGQTDQVATVTGDIVGELSAPRVAWIVKLLLVIAILVIAFLHFVWAHRVFGYCAVMLGAIPNDGRTEEGRRVAQKAARLNILAARSFNKGLRSVYFALAALAWLVGPAPLAGAAALTFAMLVRREFRSKTRKALLDD